MNTSNTIAAHWAAFEALVISPTAPQIQRHEMRLAFYAGAAAVLDITYGIGGESTSEAGGVAILQSLHDESHQFAMQLMAGRAR